MISNRFSCLFIVLIFDIQLTACGGGGGGGSTSTHKTVAQEQTLQSTWQANRLSLSGMVTDATGVAISGASVSLNNAITTTDITGLFTLADLPPRSGLLQITHSAYRAETRLVNLQLPVSVTSLTLDPVTMTLQQAAQVRLMFGGDVSFGRRYLDPAETTPLTEIPPDNAAALIQASNPQPGTQNVLQWIKPWFEEADWSVVNLETPVTNNPLTPHAEKSFIFFTLPGSLAALSWAGIDYVSLGNNHVYDYLQGGLSDTQVNLNTAGIFYSGAGASSAEAFTAYRRQIKSQNYAFISATSVSGSQYTVNYVADANKGGAADLRQDADVLATLQTELNAGYVPIVQWHTGKEYTLTPTAYAAGRMALAANNGAALVVSHHPHVAQGVAVVNGTVVVEGLGNLAFDQSRLDTFLGLTARVDMTGSVVNQLRLQPVYIKNFTPSPVGGNLANRFLRRIGEYSNGRGAIVYPYQQQGFVAFDAAQVSQTQQFASVDITLPVSGTSIVDLREYAGSDFSLSMIETTVPVSLNIGRDIMLYGDFEDSDGDTQTLETAHWDVSGESRFVCLSYAYRGTAGLCSVRDSNNSSDSLTAFRNRMRVTGDALDTPNKNLSLFGYIKGENAGPVSITARYYASVGSQTFGEEVAYQNNGGSFDWRAFSADLNMPANDLARATRIFIRHSPPSNGEATAAFDELAIINWEENLNSGVAISFPHARDFVKVQGTPGAQVNLQLTFSRYQPVN